MDVDVSLYKPVFPRKTDKEKRQPLPHLEAVAAFALIFRVADLAA